MDLFYRKLGKMIVPPPSYIPPIQLLSKKALVEVLSFFNRHELDHFQLISQQFHQLISRTFLDYPYRSFYTLDVQIDAVRESPPCKVDFSEAKSTICFYNYFECLEIFQDKKNARFKHTKFLYARKLPLDVNDELDEFVDTFGHLTHLWEGQKLDVLMMAWDKPKAAHFRSIFTNFAAGCSELRITTPERQDFPLHILFDYPDVKVTQFLRVDAFTPPNNLASESKALLYYLHRPFPKTVWITFTKGGDQLFFKQIILELKKRFQSSNELCIYTLYLIGLQNARFYSIQPFILNNEATGEHFHVTKETGDFSIAYKIIRWHELTRELEETRKGSKENGKAYSALPRSGNEPAKLDLHSLPSFGEDWKNIRYSFC